VFVGPSHWLRGQSLKGGMEQITYRIRSGFRQQLVPASVSASRALGGANNNVPLLCNAEVPALACPGCADTDGAVQAQVCGRPKCDSTADWTTSARACRLPCLRTIGLRRPALRGYAPPRPNDGERQAAMTQLGMSARAFHRTVSRLQ